MTPTPITAELRRWIVAQAEAGRRPDEVVASMCRSGWDEAVAMDAMERVLSERLDEIAAERAVAQAVPAVSLLPDPDLSDERCSFDIEGHRVHVLATLQRPRVVVFGQLLSETECDDLVALARPRLSRSETVDTDSGGTEVNAARTSDGMFFARAETPLVARIERRIATLLRWPAERGEGLQVLRYRPGAEYRPHHDYFDPERAGSASVLQRGGQRVGTVVVYLATPAGGGATTFPDVGLQVAPVKGQAVFFSYDRPHPSTLTLHGGAPVRAGEKWVATKWLRERRFE
ncbi:MAG: 2OG-Fe(II) oxygenase [Rubrivivax sp.]